MQQLGTLGNILIVDDDAAITELLLLNLRSEGYAVQAVANTAGLTLDSLADTDLLIIDASRQSPSGLELIETIRETALGDRLGIIYFSNYDSERILIQALDAGADDAVEKPFSLRELLARIRAVLRRRAALRRRTAGTAPATGNTLRLLDLHIDLDSKTASVDGQPVGLSNTEFAILVLLMRNSPNPTPRIEIFRKVWADGAGANERIVDTNISRLRRKLGPMGACIANRPGIGYVISPQDV